MTLEEDIKRIIDEALERIRREENEACAKVVEALDVEKPSSWAHRREDLPAAIRARVK